MQKRGFYRFLPFAAFLLSFSGIVCFIFPAMLPEGQQAIRHEIDSSVHKQSQELGKVFIASEQFDKRKEKQELGTVSCCKCQTEPQNLTPERIPAGYRIERKNPVFAPNEIMDLSDCISPNTCIIRPTTRAVISAFRVPTMAKRSIREDSFISLRFQ